MNRRFSPSACEVENCGCYGGVGVQAGDDFDEFHHRRRVEEVHAEQPLRMRQFPGD
jgi:hypothetical protein